MLARAIAAETGATGSLLAVRDFATFWPAANFGCIGWWEL